MKIKFGHGSFLTVFAIIFTIGLTFASIELPRLVDSLLARNVDFLDVATVSKDFAYRDPGNISTFKTELYLQHYHLRFIGYSCLALILILIVAGFVTNKSGLSSAGAVFLFLPVFGHFAMTMFFLGGLGFMRLIWMPFLDVSFNVLRLGDIVFLPYRILLTLSSFLGISIWKELPYAIIGIGLLFFMLGTLVWFYSKTQKKGVADFWVYRLSRHPQYLGWIIWSYGIMFLPGTNIKKMFDISNSLPWLLSTMIIIGVALLEELKMKQQQGEEYQSYCRRTSFLFPIPNFVSKIFSVPLRLFFKKEHFERKREIAAVLTFYLLICFVLSAFYSGLIPLSKTEVPASPDNVEQRIEKLVKVVKQAKNRDDKRHAASELAEIGELAVEPLIELLKEKNLYVRWYSANVIGSVNSSKIVKPLIDLLYDEERNVRRAATYSLGRTGSKQAVQSLIEALQDTTRGISIAAARALGAIGDQEAVKPLIDALQDKRRGTTGAAAQALGDIGANEAVQPLIRCYKEMDDCPYDKIGWALWKLGSEQALDVFIAGLKNEKWYVQTSCVKALGKIKSTKAIDALIGALKNENEKVRRAAVLALMEIQSEKAVEALEEALKDEDFEVRMYAAEALKLISNSEALKSVKEYN